MKNHIGIIGFGTMSKNISKNIIKRNNKISIFNKEKIFLKKKFLNIIIITNCLKKFLNSLPYKKIIFIIIKTGNPIKIILIKLKNKLKKNDIVIDFGNSYYKNTYINKFLIKKKFLLISSGISGGSEGALNGLCCMIDCKIQKFKLIFYFLKNIFFYKKKRYSYCLTLGFSSSHFIKMIHNGIEYGILQLISEIFFLIKILFLYKKKIINIIFLWNKSNIESYLIKILFNILIKKKIYICDIVEQKGTGRNSVLCSIKNDININTIFEAIIIRIVSKNIFFRKIFKNIIKKKIKLNLFIFIEKIKKIFFFSKLICYIQGFNQIIIIKKKYNWKINFSNLIKSYINSCIIDSKILFFLIYFKKNFFFIEKFFYIIKRYLFFNNFIKILLYLNISINFIISCSNFLLLTIKNNYNFKIIQFERNYFGNHLIKIL